MSQVQHAVQARHRKPDELFADSEEIARTFRAFRDAQGITGEPIGAEELQKRMAQLNLEPNELSRSVREMREE